MLDSELKVNSKQLEAFLTGKVQKSRVKLHK